MIDGCCHVTQNKCRLGHEWLTIHAYLVLETAPAAGRVLWSTILPWLLTTSGIDVIFPAVCTRFALSSIVATDLALSSSPPRVAHAWSQLSVMVPVTNTSPIEIRNLSVTSARLDDSRPTTLALPTFIKSLAPAREASIQVTFGPDARLIGRVCSLTLSGSYELGTRQNFYTFETTCRIPRMVRLPDSLLHASLHVETDPSLGLWTYSLRNDEPPSGDVGINSLYLRLDSLFVVVNSPSGWHVQTDNATYVIWTTQEPPPGPHATRPQGTTSGFQIRSTALFSEGMPWIAGSILGPRGGPIAIGTVLVPSTRSIGH